jgi:NADH-quinone oxidoreductase subunit L
MYEKFPACKVNMSGILITLVLALPWFGAFIVWITGDNHSKVQQTLAVLFSILTALTSLVVLFFTSSQLAILLPFGNAFGDLIFVPDGLAVSLAVIASVLGSLTVLFSVDYMHRQVQLGRYYFMMLFFIGAMNGLVLSGNLLFTFFFWEITALCSYGLISFYNDDPKAVAGGIKALIITQVSGVGLLAGTLITFANLHSYQITDVLAKANTLPASALGGIAFCFLIAAAGKSAQFPFHSWLPDAMEAPTPVSALIHAATMVNAGVYLLARFYPAFVAVPGWTLAVTLVGMLSALIAALMALTTTDLKRTLAYSTISQLGYMIYAVGVGAVFASQFHLLSHAVFKALLFLAAGAVIHSVGTRDMRKMGGLGVRMPFIRNVFIIGALALAGLPILNGFWSKELVLEAGLKQGPFWVYSLMLFGVGLTAFYTIRMTWLVFFGTEREQLHVYETGLFMRIVTFVIALGTLTTWLLAGPFSVLLFRSLPFHNLEVIPTLTVIEEVLIAPATWFALVTIMVGIGVWLVTQRRSMRKQSIELPHEFFDASFGFDWLNYQVVDWIQRIAIFLQKTQTGQLNWNILGIVGALLIVLALLWSYQ